METFWFIAVLFVLAMYIVLDGFDFGAGMIYLYVARTDAERRLTLNAIGPVWNGNEVWLVAGGGLLFFAFPKAFASGFSGFYLALILVLWLLMLRGLSIELRSHLSHPLWRPIWDATFAVSSLLLAVIFGVAIGNLTRGVPLNEDGYFYTPFWTTFLPSEEPGILDLYTVLKGFLTATLLGIHGANYIAMKTEGDVHKRACGIARVGGWTLVPLLLVNLLTLPALQPALADNYVAHPVGYLLPLASFVALGCLLYFRHKGRDVAAFFASSLFILGIIGTTAWGYYPNLLIATTDYRYNLTIYNAAASPYGLRVGLLWFIIGIILIITYTIYIHRCFWGKVVLPSGDEHS
ncbi:MAG: cytochrome d ubiquinol oxidase subunit II [Candidatus Tectomicrobia bacterium]